MRLRAGCAWIVIVTMLITSTAHARPSVGRAGGGGGGGRPAASRPAAKPQMPQSRPQARPQAMPQSRPQMPAARPNMPSNVQRPVARPGTMGAGGGVGGMARPQTPNFQRPSVGSMQRPNASRPSLPNATQRRPSNRGSHKARPAARAVWFGWQQRDSARWRVRQSSGPWPQHEARVSQAIIARWGRWRSRRWQSTHHAPRSHRWQPTW